MYAHPYAPLKCNKVDKMYRLFIIFYSFFNARMQSFNLIPIPHMTFFSIFKFFVTTIKTMKRVLQQLEHIYFHYWELWLNEQQVTLMIHTYKVPITYKYKCYVLQYQTSTFFPSALPVHSSSNYFNICSRFQVIKLWIHKCGVVPSSRFIIL